MRIGTIYFHMLIFISQPDKKGLITLNPKSSFKFRPYACNKINFCTTFPKLFSPTNFHQRNFKFYFCREESDLGLCMSSVLANRMRLRSADF